MNMRVGISALITVFMASSCSASVTSTTSDSSNSIPQSCAYVGGGSGTAGGTTVVMAKGLVCLTLQSVLSKGGQTWTPFDGQESGVMPACVLTGGYKGEDGTITVYELDSPTSVYSNYEDVCANEESIGWTPK